MSRSTQGWSILVNAQGVDAKTVAATPLVCPRLRPGISTAIGNQAHLPAYHALRQKDEEDWRHTSNLQRFRVVRACRPGMYTAGRCASAAMSAQARARMGASRGSSAGGPPCAPAAGANSGGGAGGGSAPKQARTASSWTASSLSLGSSSRCRVEYNFYIYVNKLKVMFSNWRAAASSSTASALSLSSDNRTMHPPYCCGCPRWLSCSSTV